MAPRKSPIEFYDTQTDPFEVRNLANSAAHAPLIATFAKRLDNWMIETQDKGTIPEPKEELDQWIKPAAAMR
jgi:N-sulfoglucosamine sulfohydrolase